MKIIGIIPARLASERLHEKVIRAINGYPMLWYIYANILSSKYIDEIFIATDSEKIKREMLKYNIPVIMTSKDHPSGTDRLGEVARRVQGDIFVNIQGDEPLISSAAVDSAIKPIVNNKDIDISTLCKSIKQDRASDPNIVKVVFDRFHRALYFSRSKIPYNRSNIKLSYYKHIGIYVFRRATLIKFSSINQPKMEKAEKLEQLRLLYNGYYLHVVETEYDSIGVDTEQDLVKAEKKIIELGMKEKLLVKYPQLKNNSNTKRYTEK